MLDPIAAPDAADTAAGVPAARQRTLAIQFTGSGSEYFRIWSVNLLLILVTLGLYLPFAKARRIRYFYANTLIDGQALSFHGDPWKMFRGFILLVLLMGIYSATGRFAPSAALPAFIVLCAIWPALWRASLQFRLGNTAWRGLRFRFEGSLKRAYLACAPVYLPTIAFIGVVRLLTPQASGDPELDRAAMDTYGYTVLMAMGVVALFTPWSLALIKRYQHNGYRLAGQRARLELGVGAFYKLSLKTFGVGLLIMLMGIALVVGLGFAFGKGLSLPPAMAQFAILGGVLFAYLVMFAVVLPFAAARSQNLVWNATRSQAVGFDSRLRFKALCGLTLKNWLLTALTLSLYRPFAAVATARMRLEAVQIGVDEDPADWMAPDAAQHADATGEVAGDFFGIDMGL